MAIQSTADVFNQSTSSGITSSSNSSNNSSSSSSSSASSSSSSSAASISTNSASSASSVSSSSNSEFAAFLKTAMGGGTKSEVSEEELYAGLIEQRLNEKSKDAAEFYHSEMEKLLTSMRQPNGNVSYEDVALAALNNTVSAGKLTKEEAEVVNGEAFSGAQLDNNLDALFDNIGSENDPTKAVASISEAISKSESFVNGIKDGTKKIESRSLSIGSTGRNYMSGGSAGSLSLLGSSLSSSSASGSQRLDGPGGFLWKPVSDSDGKLAVLLPKSFAGQIEKLEVHSSLPPSDSSKVAEGSYKYDSNGGRPTFRFSKPGASYGDNLYVVAFKKDGSTATWDIEDGGKRND